MDEKCLICQEIHDPETYVFMGEIMDKFQNLMEGSEFDVNSVKNTLICKNCENQIETFFNFKSSFVEKEDELLNYMDEDYTVDLCAMLITKGELDKKDYHGTLRVCRICFKTTEGSNFKEIRTHETDITKLTTCYPDFDIFLTGTTYICLECENNVLNFHDFHSSCFKAIENVTILEDPLKLDITSSTKGRDLNSKAQNRKKPSPPVPAKKKRGRPKKVENCNINRPRKVEKSSTNRPKNVEKSNRSRNEYITKEEIERILQEENDKKCNFSYECQVCPGIFDSLESLLKHMRFHETQRKFICWNCGALFPYLHLLRNHFHNHGIDIFKIVAQEGEKSDDEERIGKISTGEKSLPPVNNHSIDKVTDTFQRIECQLCLQKFRTLSSFQKHIEAHEKVKEFHCLKCMYTSDLITDIQRHLASSHQIPNLFRIIHFRHEDDLDEEEMHVDTTEKKILPITNNRKYCCGHCSEIFFNLNELEDHTCTPHAAESDVKIPLKNKPESGGYSADNNLATVQGLDSNQSIKDDYECNFCSSSFKTLKALDSHECPGDEGSSTYTTNDGNLKCSTCTLKFESCAVLAAHSCSKFGPAFDSNCSIDSIENINENSEKFKFVTKKLDRFHCSNCSTSFESFVDILIHSCDISISTSESSKFHSKMEEPFHCSYCNAAFDTADNLNLHNCFRGCFPSKPEAFPEEHDNEVDNRFEIEIDKHSGVVMSSNVQENRDTQSVTVGSSAHCGKIEMANDYDIGNDETVKTSIKEKPNKKEIVNRIAYMFGIQILEGANRERQNMKKEFGCVGCNFKASKKKDLLIHINYCGKVKKCSYCPYRTNVSHELELHSYVAHDVIIYACSNCRFVTSMEENFKSHMSVHIGVVKKENYLEEESNEKEHGKNSVEFENKIDIKDEKVESVEVEQKLNCEIDETSVNEYIGEINNGQELNRSYEVVDPIRLNNENTCNTVKTSTLNRETLIPRKLHNGDSSTRIITEEVSRNTDVIDINSDSDNEFIEPSQDRATVVGEIRTIDHDEASQLISQGIPVVKNSDLLRMDTSEGKSDFETMEAGRYSHFVEPVHESSCIIEQSSLNFVPESIERFDIFAPLFDSEMESNDYWAEFGLSLNHTLITLLKEAAKKHNLNQEVAIKPAVVSSRDSWDLQADNTAQNISIVIDSDGESQTNDYGVMSNMAIERLSNKFSKTSKNPPGHRSDSSIIKRPPNAFYLFFERLKKAMEKRFSSISGTERRSLIVNIWKNMSYQDKWLYLEEARLQRLLFRREHPELSRPIPRKRKKLCLPETEKPFEEQSNLNEEIILD